MFHAQKGVAALRIDGARSVCLRGVRIAETHNTGGEGNVRALPGERNDAEAAYVGADDGGHPDQTTTLGYAGADVRGVSLAGSYGVFLSDVRVGETHARVGNARGIDIFNAANATHFCGAVHVDGVSTLVSDAERVLSGAFANGPRVGQAIGVRATTHAARSTYGAGCAFVRRVGSRVLEQALEFAVDSAHDYVARPAAVDGAPVNPYTL